MMPSVLDLDPMLRSSRLIGSVAAFRNQTFKAHVAHGRRRVQSQATAIVFHFMQPVGAGRDGGRSGGDAELKRFTHVI
jgi:hypothetical protein